MANQMKSIIVGTAGHIDHGKTALVKALTGIDADRLEEEKRRGITIDLGFAHTDLSSPSGETLRLGFVDVPGHERFVRNMLAGVGGIDLVLLVIAADEAIKPQTREHFDILQLLGVRRGITVLTKSDAVDAETLEVVRLEVEEFLRGTFLDRPSLDKPNLDKPNLGESSLDEPNAIIAVSSLTGAGLVELKRAIVAAAGDRSPADRSCIHYERLRHGGDGDAGGWDDTSRGRTGSFPIRPAGARARSAGARANCGGGDRRTTNRAEPGGGEHTGLVARHDPRAAGNA
jgi:small GTP-binding protein